MHQKKNNLAEVGLCRKKHLSSLTCKRQNRAHKHRDRQTHIHRQRRT